MKIIFVAISLLLTWFQLYSQKNIPGQVSVTSKGSLVVLKDLPKNDYRPSLGNVKRSANESEEEENEYEENKIEITTNEQSGNLYTPVSITPVTKSNSSDTKLRAPDIFEAPCVSYSGMQKNFFFPPDVTSATGFDHIMLADNDSFKVINKYGNILWQEAEGQASGFWSIVGGTGLFDPKLTYDALSNRWIFVIATDSRTAASSILIAVSQSYDPTGGWWIYRIDTDADNNQWFDYPSVGFNRNWIVVSGNMFSNPSAGGTAESRTFVFDKGPMYLNGGSTTFFTFNAASGYQTICPALTYDANDNDLWMASNNTGSNNSIRYFRIGGTATAATFTQEGIVSINGGWSEGGNDIAPQSGIATLLNAGNNRILSSVMRGGRLYTAQTVFFPSGGSPNTCSIQMISATPATTTVHEAVRLNSSTTSMFAYPNLVVNANGDWIITCARFTNAIFPSSVVIVRRNGNPTFFETTFAVGQDWYVDNDSNTPQRNRWGDYYGAMVDPSDDNSVWVSGEYSLPRGFGNIGRWASKISKVCSGICNSDVTVSLNLASGTFKKFEAANTVFATAQIQSGAYIKLDGGARVILQPGFRANNGSKVRAFIEGCGGVQ